MKASLVLHAEKLVGGSQNESTTPQSCYCYIIDICLLCLEYSLLCLEYSLLCLEYSFLSCCMAEMLTKPLQVSMNMQEVCSQA